MDSKRHGLPIKIDLPENYLEEEVRCDYTVSREMKEVWAVELDLLSELARVCRMHNIDFYAEGGTLLGCVRHKGFIPWDDDIDIAMTRDNYKKLCAAANDFHFPYFLQTEQTDVGSMRGHAQLRNSLTTGALKHETDLQINQGIFIDIFPMDVVPDDPETFEKQKKEIYKYREKAFFYGRKMFSLSKKSKLKRALKLAIIKTPVTKNYLIQKGKKFYKQFEDASSQFDSTNAERISLLSFKCEEACYIRKRSYYCSAELRPFEFMEIPVPAGYDSILTIQYGNYMEMVKGNTWHGEVIFDTRTPYDKLLTQYRQKKID